MALSLYGCSKVQSDYSYVFPITENLNFSDSIELQDDIMFPVDAELFDSLLFIGDPRNVNGQIKLFDVNTGRLISVSGRTGKGPAELLFMEHIRVDGENRKVEVFDGDFYKFNIYDLDSLISRSYVKPSVQKEIPPYAFKAQYIADEDNSFVTLGSDANSKMFAIHSTEDSVVSFYDFPDDLPLSPSKMMAYQGDLRLSPSKNKFVYASFSSDLMVIGNIDDNKVGNIITKYNYLPKYTDRSSDGIMAVSYDVNTPNGFSLMKTTDKYIYALFSGRTKESHPDKYYLYNEIYIMDWDGNPIRKLVLDRDAYVFCIDQQGKNLYAISLSGDNYVGYHYELQ